MDLFVVREVFGKSRKAYALVIYHPELSTFDGSRAQDSQALGMIPNDDYWWNAHAIQSRSYGVQPEAYDAKTLDL